MEVEDTTFHFQGAQDIKDLSKRERKKLRRQTKQHQEQRSASLGKLKRWAVYLSLAALVGGGIYLWQTRKSILPPTSAQGHLESVPPSHIMDRPIGEAVQRHMLEHADGTGPPGVIINYNCQDFSCEEGLVDALAEIAQKYPEFVYLAPYPRMSAKIALTRLGQIKTLESFDKDAIVAFIEE